MNEPTDNSREPSNDESVEIPSSSGAGVDRQSAHRVLPQRSTDETDIGWGDTSGELSDDWYLRERPPHHG